jgi:hypothetical protein
MRMKMKIKKIKIKDADSFVFAPFTLVNLYKDWYNSSEFGVRSSEFGVRSSEFGVALIVLIPF